MRKRAPAQTDNFDSPTRSAGAASGDGRGAAGHLAADCGLAVEKNAQIIHASGRPREAEIVGHVTKSSDPAYCTSNYMALYRARAISTALMVEARA
jgi:hypothetical protein